MYFHDSTFEKQLKSELIQNGYIVRFIQAEHKIGRIRIFLPFNFQAVQSLTDFIVNKMATEFNSEWINKSVERKNGYEISAFSADQCMIEFKQTITI